MGKCCHNYEWRFWHLRRVAGILCSRGAYRHTGLRPSAGRNKCSSSFRVWFGIKKIRYFYWPGSRQTSLPSMEEASTSFSPTGCTVFTRQLENLCFHASRPSAALSAYITPDCPATNNTFPLSFIGLG